MHVALSIVDIIPQMLTLLSQPQNSFVYTCFNAQKLKVDGRSEISDCTYSKSSCGANMEMERDRSTFPHIFPTH